MAELEPGIVGRDVVEMERFYTEAMGFVVTARMQFDAFGTVLRLARGERGAQAVLPG